MNLNAQLNEYFFVDGVPILLQSLFLAALNIYNILVVLILKKRYQYFSFGILFILLNTFFLNFFILSHAGGMAGFASARGQAAFGFDYQLFFVLLCQSVLTPLIFLGLAPRSKTSLIEFQYRSKSLYILFIIFLTTYILLYFIIVKPGIYYAFIGDFKTAKEMRISAVLGNTSENGAPTIFNYKNLVVWGMQGIILGLLINSKRSSTVVILAIIFLFLAFVNFSKGTLVSGLLCLFMGYSFKNKNSSLFKFFIFGNAGILILVLYTYMFHESGVLLENAFKAILRRIYNNSSSAYLQINLYNHLIPNYLYIQDWGKIGDLFALEPIIPKQLVYRELYAGQGQGGSSFASDSFLAFGWTFVILIPLLMWPVLVMDFILYHMSLENTASKIVCGYIIFFGVGFVNNIQSTPFSIINIFTFIRIEYIFYILVILSIFSMKVMKN